jgi:hypothetical protein
MLAMDRVANELELPPRLNGRANAPLEVALVRELGEADMALLRSSPAPSAPPRKRMRDRHHALARCLAEGAKPWEASAITGYSPSTVSILQADPSFKELVAFYREHTDAAFAEFTKRATLVTLTALDNIQEQVEDESNPLSLEQNLTIVKTLADRTGYAPQSRQVNVSVGIDVSGRLASAKARLAERAAKALPGLIEGEFEVVGDRQES